MSVEVITTVLVPAAAVPPASPYDLTDLPTARSEFSITDPNNTSDDAFLSRAITQASNAISRYCGRTFQAEVIQDLFYAQEYAYPWQIPGGGRALQLSRWPLPFPAVVTFTGNSSSSRLISGISSAAGLMVGMPVFASDGSIQSGITVGSFTQYTVMLSGPTSSKATGLTFTAGLQVVQTLSDSQTQTLVYGTDFTVDAKKGWVIRLDKFTGQQTRWEAVPTTVQYLGGYQEIPGDLEDACLRLVTARFRARGRDPMLVERTQGQLAGSERYWVGTSPGQRGAFAPEIQALLDAYRVPVTA